MNENLNQEEQEEHKNIEDEVDVFLKSSSKVGRVQRRI
jgi:hypothetical protein